MVRNHLRMTTTTARRTVTVPASAYDASARQGMTAGYDDDQDDLVLPAESMSLSPDNLAERVQTTQQRLSALRVEAEALEREKLRMEELSRKQREFMSGRSEVSEKLGRAIAMLDRESYEAQKRVEQLLVIKDGFHQHLELLQTMNPEEWDPQALPQDLSRAIGIIEDAREEYAKAMARVQLLTNASTASISAATAAVVTPARDFTAPRGGMPMEFSREAFRAWAFCGAAFSLPLIVCAGLYLLVRLIAG
jgi:hypothetical protein